MRLNYQLNGRNTFIQIINVILDENKYIIEVFNF